MLPYFQKDILEVGIDEAGRGSLIGDVYAAAVIWPKEIEDNFMKLNDSKKLSRRRRLILKDYIEENACDFSVAHMDNETIDKINILNATFKAMHQAINGLNIIPEYIIVDGDRFLPYFDKDDELISTTCITNGDGTYDPIAAASILAKVYHDRHIEDLCQQYPDLDEHYKLLSNMGYGTKLHLEGIRKYGITPFHRKTYAPCKNYISSSPSSPSLEE